MSTVRVEKCPECGTYVGEGTLYDHQQRLCPRRIIAASKRVRVTPTCPFCGVVEPCRVHVVAPAGLPAMSAPGADPLAAIRLRHRYASYISSDRLQADVLVLLKQWDTYQSALRALVAQWREEIGGDPLDRFDDGWVAAKGGCIEQLERLISGPQP